MKAARLEGLRVLVVDDEPDIRQGLRKLLGTSGATVEAAADGQEALERLEREPFDLVLTDLMMPRRSGAELLADIGARWPEIAVLVFTGYGTIQTAVACLQGGAAHFITKPFDNEEVLRIVGGMGRQLLARRTLIADRGAPAIVAEDPTMLRVLELVRRVAPTPVPVLIEGESGTGKELVARAIHEASSVASRPFSAVNAAALPDTLLESELFGHKKGAFTGADKDRQGLFALAQGGTVFLDEVSSMSPAFQGKLLRVLQEKRVRPLGAGHDVEVEFRLVSATNRPLEAMIRQGEFREDLFYRIGVLRIPLPPLRDRPLDVEPLALRLLEEAAHTCLPAGAPVPRLSGAALEALHQHRWPGNVRELANTLQRAVVVCPGDTIQPHHLGLAPTSWAEGPSESLDYVEMKQVAIERFQREFVQRALEASGGNVSRAAERCGLTRAALQRIMRQHGIERSAF